MATNTANPQGISKFLQGLLPNDPLNSGLVIKTKPKFNIDTQYIPFDFTQKVELNTDTTPNFQKMTQRRNWFKGYVLTKAMMIVYGLIAGKWFLTEHEHNEITKALIILREVYKNHKMEHYKLKKIIKNKNE